jgi:hypothetical protein
MLENQALLPSGLGVQLQSLVFQRVLASSYKTDGARVPADGNRIPQRVDQNEEEFLHVGTRGERWLERPGFGDLNMATEQVYFVLENYQRGCSAKVAAPQVFSGQIPDSYGTNLPPLAEELRTLLSCLQTSVSGTGVQSWSPDEAGMGRSWVSQIRSESTGLQQVSGRKKQAGRGWGR